MIRWRLHLASRPEAVYPLLATDAGRARFWGESTREAEGELELAFPDGTSWRGRVLAAVPGELFAVDYFGAEARFELRPDGAGGTDLTLTHALEDAETQAGWVSVLMALKAAADFDVDLRNHDPERTWLQGYADN